MNALDREMLQILALARDTSVRFSDRTHRWYVSAAVSVSDGHVLTSGGHHEHTPDLAVAVFLHHLKEIDYDHVVVTRVDGQRRQWRWNGVTFAEDPHWRPAPQVGLVAAADQSPLQHEDEVRDG